MPCLNRNRWRPPILRRAQWQCSSRFSGCWVLRHKMGCSRVVRHSPTGNHSPASHPTSPRASNQKHCVLIRCLYVSPQIHKFLCGIHCLYQPKGKVMFSRACVILFTIGLLATRLLLILVNAWSVCILLESFLVYDFRHTKYFSKCCYSIFFITVKSFKDRENTNNNTQPYGKNTTTNQFQINYLMRTVHSSLCCVHNKVKVPTTSQTVGKRW